MPQIDAVTFIAEQGQDGRLRQRTGAGLLVLDHVDQVGKKQAYEKHAALIEKRCFAVYRDKERADDEKENDKPRGRVFPHLTAQIFVLLPDGAQKNTDKQRKRHSVGSVVYPGRIFTGGVEHKHPAGGKEGEQQKDKAHLPAADVLAAFLVKYIEDWP